jgi:hypothetical protein
LLLVLVSNVSLLEAAPLPGGCKRSINIEKADFLDETGTAVLKTPEDNSQLFRGKRKGVSNLT